MQSGWGGRSAPRIWAALGLSLLVALKIGGATRLLGWACLASGVVLVVVAVRNRFSWLDAPRTALLLLGLSGLYSAYPLLAGDGIEYYALLRSPLFDHDLDLSNDFEAFHFQPLTTDEGVPVSRQGIGVALCWAPLVSLTHVGVVVADLFGAGIPKDGFAPPYQRAATVTSFLLGFSGLLLLEGMLRSFYGAGVAFLSIVGAYLATPLHFYLVANPFMSHGVSFFAAAAFLLAWLRARRASDPTSWTLVGAAGGLMALIRAHDTVLLMLPLLDLLFGQFNHKKRLAAHLFLVPVAFGLFQLFVWWRLYGSSLLGGVLRINRVHGFAFHPLEVLLSPRHGLLTWAPVVVLAILGLLLFLRRNFSLGLLLLLGCCGAILINSVFEDWWGSQSFGQRRLLSLTPIFALGLGESLTFLRGRPLLPIGAILLALIGWNLQFERIYNMDLAAEKWEPVTLEALASAQVDLLYRGILSAEDRLPPRLFAFLYDLVKGVWLDEGARSLKGRVMLGEEKAPVGFLIGDGWYRPQAEDGTRFRRSRGRHSSLHIPIFTPGDFRAILTARLELTEAPVEVSLDVNGEDCGSAELEGGWHDYAFDVPAKSIRSGINVFGFRYSTTPRKERPAAAGKNAVVAVQSFKLSRLSGAPPKR